MKSIESQIDTCLDVAKRNGKDAEATAIMKEGGAGRSLERKLSELDKLVKPFLESMQESAGKNELVESYKRNLGFTEKEARIAAGVERSHKNDGYGWDILSEAKGK